MSDETGRAGRLAAIEARALECMACRLSETRTRVVFGEGNPDAPLVFVGEGPGEQEDLSGRPFVGRAGILLDECLRENSMTRKHVYICNTVKCRACLYEGGRARNRAPRPDEIVSCSAWLDEQLRAIEPQVIVCLGAPAANTLIHTGFKMLQERGQWFTTCGYSRYVMAALHPAFVLRQAGEAYLTSRRQLVDDIGAARRKVIEARKEPPLTLF